MIKAIDRFIDRALDWADDSYVGLAIVVICAYGSISGCLALLFFLIYRFICM